MMETGPVPKNSTGSGSNETESYFEGAEESSGNFKRDPPNTEISRCVEVKKFYKAAVADLEGVRKLQNQWDQKGIPEKK